MPDLREAQDILTTFGLPKAQQNEMSALTLLALCGLKPDQSWSYATRQSMTITKGIMAFIAQHYGKSYAPNTRETFRRQVLHQFVQARIADYNPDDVTLPTNSPKAHYAISEVALDIVRAYGTPAWIDEVAQFSLQQDNLSSYYIELRREVQVMVTLPDGTSLVLSPGAHNQLAARVLSQFMPFFAPNAEVLYVGDTADKTLFVAEEQFQRLNISISAHDKLPDIVLYWPEKRWLFLIEVVTSHGPMTPKRIIELNALLQNSRVQPIFVTAFLSFAEFRKYSGAIAWETEVWIADAPEHLIHFNGNKFLGPYQR